MHKVTVRIRGAGKIFVVGVLRATVNPVYNGNIFKPGDVAALPAPLLPASIVRICDRAGN